MPYRIARSIATLTLLFGLGGCAPFGPDATAPPDDTVEDPLISDPGEQASPPSSPYEACMSNAQCDVDTHCVEGRCVPLPDCQTYVDCPGDYICSEGRCAPGTAGPRAIEDTSPD